MDNDDDKKVHFGTGVKVTWRSRLFSRSVLLAVAGLVALGAGFWVYTGVRSTLDERNQNDKILSDALQSSSAARVRNDYKQAYDLLKPLEDKARTKKQKTDYYQSMYLNASSTNRLAESLTYLVKKHKADPSTAKADAYSMAQDYERLGDKSKALVQYKLALEYEKSKTGFDNYPERIARIEQSIKSLEEQQ